MKNIKDDQELLELLNETEDDDSGSVGNILLVVLVVIVTMCICLFAYTIGHDKQQRNSRVKTEKITSYRGYFL